jgi:hypothetical protein
MKRIAGVALVAALMCVSLVAVATGHVRKVDSDITFHIERNGADQGDSTVTGKVSSHKHQCESFRVVEIYQVNEFDSRRDYLVDTTVTNANGRYETPPGGAFIGPASFYAKAVRSVAPTGPGHHHVCKRAFSQTQTAAGGPVLRG